MLTVGWTDGFSYDMPDIIPIKDLRDTTKISEKCHSVDEPIYVTKNGYGDMVIMSMETYNSISTQDEVDNAIMHFEKEMTEEKEFLDAKDALTALRRKYIG